MNIQPVGFVRCPITEPVDENWGSVISWIRLKKPWVRGLQGLEEFSHLLIVFQMHKAVHNQIGRAHV